jgi:hypothetical protein
VVRIARANEAGLIMPDHRRDGGRRHRGLFTSD